MIRKDKFAFIPEKITSCNSVAFKWFRSNEGSLRFFPLQEIEDPSFLFILSI